MLLCCLIGFFYRSYFYSVLLMDLVHREETLYNVIRSVTRNGRSIAQSALGMLRGERYPPRESGMIGPFGVRTGSDDPVAEEDLRGGAPQG